MGDVVQRDWAGKLTGRLRAPLDQAAMHAKYGHLWTAEDLARAEEAANEKGGHTHAEVMAYLRSLDAK